MRSKLTISVIIVLAIAAVLAAAYLWQTKRTISLSVAEVEKNAAVRVFGLGTVEARVISKVGFEVGAALTELLADQGDRVRKGDVLARLHPADIVDRGATKSPDYFLDWAFDQAKARGVASHCR